MRTAVLSIIIAAAGLVGVLAARADEPATTGCGAEVPKPGLYPFRHGDKASLLSVSRLELVSDSEDEDDIFCGQPTILRDIPIAAPRQNEFAPAVLHRSPE